MLEDTHYVASKIAIETSYVLFIESKSVCKIIRPISYKYILLMCLGCINLSDGEFCE